jgi:heme/copper-type cytochrome/quinol oxidase subunit 2
MSVLWVCAIVAAAVFARMIYSVATVPCSAARGDARRHALLETLWAIVPIAIMVGSALPAVRQLLSDEAAMHSAQPLQAHKEDFS